MTARRVLLFGHGIAASRSPSMMNQAFAAMEVSARYESCDVGVDEFQRVFADAMANENVVGANVTAPHKLAVLTLCDAIHPLAARIGAANVVYRHDGRTVACNTDAEGCVRALRDEGVGVHGMNAVILGAGGAARAVAVGLAHAGARHVAVVARRIDRANDVALRASGVGSDASAYPWARLPEALARAELVVQATGARDERFMGQTLERAFESVPAGVVAMDLGYVPAQTPWLVAARARGLRTVNGLGMLAHQGALALRHWFGRGLSADRMRRLLDVDEASG